MNSSEFRRIAPKRTHEERKPGEKADRLNRDAAVTERIGMRALRQLIPPRPVRVMLDRRLPPISEAPRGARVIQSSRGCVALSLNGSYLGLFALEE